MFATSSFGGLNVEFEFLDWSHALWQGIYRAFVRNAKFMTPASAPHIAFLGSCVVEMFGLDMSVAYEHAFTYIRQLAAVLRSALSNKTTDAFREVYCWQTINTLELWAKLLAAHSDKKVHLYLASCVEIPADNVCV